jgi:hypothetical protein
MVIGVAESVFCHRKSKGGGDDVDLEMPIFFEDLEKIDKTIFQSRG